MSSNCSSFFRAFLLCSISHWCLSSTTARGQSCVYNFSEYFNVYASADGATLYSSVTVSDNSGCNHSQYANTVSITSPSGRTGSSAGSGLAGTTSLAITNEAGTYQTYTSGTFYCPAIRGFAGFGGGMQLPLRKIQAYYKCDQNMSGSCALSGGISTYRRCNPSTHCPVIGATPPANKYLFALKTIWEITIGISYDCAGIPLLDTQVSQCFSPDPIP